MKFIKNNFFFFCFLFIFFSINAETKPGKSTVAYCQQTGNVIAAPEQHREEKELEQFGCNVQFCFRLTEISSFCFQAVKNIHPLLFASSNTRALFSKEWYAAYGANRLNRLSSLPLFMRYRRLLI